MSLDTEVAGATAAPEPTPVTIVETPETSLEDDLSATWDKLNADDAGDDGEADDSGPVRGPDGKFAKRNADPETGEQSADREASDDTESADQPEENAGTDTSVDVPATWSAEMQERFQALPPEFNDFKTYVAQREQETGDAISRVGQEVLAVEQELMRFEPVDQVIQANRHMFERRGIHPAQGIAAWARAQDLLDENPLSGIAQIGQSYGKTPLQLAQELYAWAQNPQLQQQQAQPHPVEPYVQALQAQIAQLQGKMTAQEQAAYQAEEQRLNHTIEEFARDKPYFNDVRQVMATLINGGQAADLATAYDMAIHASPKVRARIQQDAQKAQEAKRAAEQKAKAEQARKSTAVNVRSGTVNSANPKTMDDTLGEIARRHYG